MDTALRLPAWPPLRDEPIGAELATQYVSWMHQHIEPVLETGRRKLRILLGDDVEIVTRLYAAESIAGWRYSPYAP